MVVVVLVVEAADCVCTWRGKVIKQVSVCVCMNACTHACIHTVEGYSVICKTYQETLKTLYCLIIMFLCIKHMDTVYTHSKIPLYPHMYIITSNLHPAFISKLRLWS